MTTITVLCPGCESKLTAPPAAAGKKVKCPKCQALMLMPGSEPAADFEVVDDDFEVVEDEPAPSRSAATRSPRSGSQDAAEPPRKLAKRYIPSDDDADRPRRRREEDEDDFADRPRKKRKKKAASSIKVPLIIGGCVLGVLILAIGAYFAFSGSSKSPASTNWVKFDAPDGSFSTSFPDSAPVSGDYFDLVTKFAPAAEMAKARQQMGELKNAGINIYAWSCNQGRRRYTIAQMKFPDAIAKLTKPEDVMNILQQENNKVGKENGGREKVVFEKSVTVSGQPAKQIGVTNSNSKQSIQIMTACYANGSLYMIIVDSEEMADNDAMMQAFVNKFEIKGGGPSPAKANQPSTPAPSSAPTDNNTAANPPANAAPPQAPPAKTPRPRTKTPPKP